MNARKFATQFITATILATCSIQTTQACTREEAFNKMMALGRYQTRMMANPAALDDRQQMNFAQEVAAVGQTLADQKFDEACRRYDEIAKKYGVSLSQEQKGLVTLEEAQKDGGRRGGTCSQADAHLRLMNMTNELEERAAEGKITRDTVRQFAMAAGQYSELEYTNPSAFCGELEKIGKQFGVSTTPAK